MSQDDSSGAPDYGKLEKTSWTMVLQAVQSQAPGASQALAALCGRYWRPLYSFARRRGYSPDDSEDLVQGFFEHLISGRGLATVDRSKGKFRSFLLASFQNFMAAEHRHAHAEKRGGRAQMIRLDCQDAEARLGLEPEDRVTPEMLYDAQWALLLLQRATERLRREQAAIGKAEIFQTLKGFLGSDIGTREQITYNEAARSLGISEAAVTTIIHRLRQRHKQLVREEIEHTLFDPAEVDAELHGLCEALLHAEGRIGT
ncbi:MAG: sigma-70 family RNA polymerase sigma factor [Verrucomicrobia bacterium]|nr:sigma-70 family RNA polymerase sigma factor [Verrucomicrobiota bacterium]